MHQISHRHLAWSVGPACVALLLAGGTVTGVAAQSAAPQKSPASATAVEPKDKPFLEMIARDNQAEIELARLALDKAENADVKAYAGRLLQDHQKAQDELRKVAREAGVTLPQGLTEEQQSLERELSTASGRDFDEKYIDAMVGGHKAAVAVLELESTQGDYQAASNFAKEALPTIQDHLRRAQQLHTQLEQKTPSPSQQ